MAYVDADKRVKIISWGSVIAGAITVLAVLLLLSLLTSGLGLGAIDAQSSDPLSGAGSTFGWMSAVSLLIALGVGGYLAGYLSGVAGWVHGFLTWALAMLVAAYLSFAAIGGAISLTGNVIGGVANATGAVAGAAGNALGGAAGAAGNAIGGLTQALDRQVINTVDGDEIAAQLRQAVQQANIEALQPDLIEAELTGARDDVTTAGQDLLNNPGDYEAIVERLIASLQDRVETLSAEINRDDVVAAISANTNLSEAQVEEAADRAIGLYQDTAETARVQLNNVEAAVTEAQQRLVALQEQAKEQADRAAAAAASAALWAFFGALLGAVVAIGAGVIGARSPVDARPRY